MIGSPAVAALIAQCGFWILLVVGWMRGELRLRGIAIFIGLWVAGVISLQHVPYGGLLSPSYVAVLDIALVFAIFKGDIRLT